MQTDEPIEEDSFSLNTSENIQKLELILDDLILQLEVDKKKFTTLFKNLPLNIYLKIDTLRNVTTDKKSAEFKLMAAKAKKVSRAFHNQFK